MPWRPQSRFMFSVFRLPRKLKGRGMDALVIGCSQPWFWQGCTGCFMHSKKHNDGWMHWSPYALGTRTLLWSGQGFAGQCMHLENEHYHGLGMKVD